MEILGNLSFIKVYIDDLLIYSMNKEDHYNNLKEVFKRLKANNICINFEKSDFCKNEVKFIGQIVSNLRVKADIKNIKNLSDLKTPKTKQDIQKIIGMIQ